MCEGKWGPGLESYDQYFSVLRCKPGEEKGEKIVNAGILGGYSSGICPHNFDDFFYQLKKALD